MSLVRPVAAASLSRCLNGFGRNFDVSIPRMVTTCRPSIAEPKVGISRLVENMLMERWDFSVFVIVVTKEPTDPTNP